MTVAYVPSPTQAVWHIGPLPVRAYALCILTGIIVAMYTTERRWVARGGQPGMVSGIAGPTVMGGVIGARLYHVLTDPELYFGAGRNPVDAVKVWDGGLGIPGALLLGAAGAWWGCRRAGVSLPTFADTVAPGVALAQALGRWGNWFNNELHGRATDLPWRLRVYEWADGRAVRGADGQPVVAGYFHPTFLYESLWDAGLAVMLVLVDRTGRLARGSLIALYVTGYGAGRLWVESLRDDHANTILGLRVNIWISLIAAVAGAAYLLATRHRSPRRTFAPGTETLRAGVPPAAAPASVHT